MTQKSHPGTNTSKMCTDVPQQREAQRYRTALCLIHPRLTEVDQMRKLRYIHILEYYTAGRMNKLEQHTTAEVNPPKHKVEQKNPDTKSTNSMT